LADLSHEHIPREPRHVLLPEIQTQDVFPGSRHVRQSASGAAVLDPPEWCGEARSRDRCAVRPTCQKAERDPSYQLGRPRPMVLAAIVLAAAPNRRARETLR